MTDPVVQDLNAETENVMEIESLCMRCYEEGMTRLMLTRIPFFREVIISSFSCEHCNHSDTGIQPGGSIQEKGVNFTLKVTKAEDMNRTVVKSDYAVISIPEIIFEKPPEKKGEINTIEGIFDAIKEDLSFLQEKRRQLVPDLAAKIDDFISKMDKLRTLEEPFTFIMDDPSGNSFIENPNAPSTDENLAVVYYLRNKEQDIHVGCCVEDDEEEGENDDDDDDDDDATSEVKSLQEEVPQANWNFQGEVMTFQTNCPECQSSCETNMKLVDIPFFKQIVIMATTCESCGHRDNEVKGGTGVEPKGRMISLLVKNKEDLSRDLLKSDTAGIKIPELDFEMLDGSLGGRFTTVEGLLVQIKEQLSEKNPFIQGDSSQSDMKNRVMGFCEKLEQILSGELKDIHIILNDPAGNSYIQNLCTPDPDPQLMTEDFERTFEQNEELGLNDMKVENYSNDNKEDEDIEEDEEEDKADDA